MFESQLAPATADTVVRDLSSFDVWEISLERSRRRRELAAKPRTAAPKTKATAAALSAALLVTPMAPVAPAGAGTGGGAARSASLLPAAIDGLIASRGDTGGPVAAVQRTLGVDDDGIFGPVTERAVADFQARVGLTPTGVVDAETWKALLQAAVTGVQPQPAKPKPTVTAPKRPTRLTVPKPRRGVSGGTRPVADVTLSKAPAPPAPAAAGSCGGPLATPVAGVLTSGFGDGRRHAGIDLSAPAGTPVVAAACGTVTRAGSESGYGTMLCIQHSATFSTCYAHLSEIAAQRGVYVEVGQVIGKVGMTGRSSGPHLHFETRVNGHAQDPAQYLSR